MLAALFFLSVTQGPTLPPAGDLPALVARLDKPKQTRPEVFRKLFLAMWAQVPNWKSGDPMWIRQPEPPWVPPPPPPTHAEMETARAEAIETVTAMRAIAATRRLDAVDPIFKLAFEYDG